VATAPFTWRVLVRRGWLLVLGVLLGIGAGAAIARVSVSAEGAFRVTGAGVHQTPYQVSRLARTYASLLPEEPGVVARVADDVGLSQRAVRERLTLTARPATAVVFARYSADSAGAAFAGFDAVTRALRKEQDAAGGRLRATITPLSDPTVENGLPRARALLLGAAAGGLLALVLILALERRAPRVDGVNDLASLVPMPISRVRVRALPAVVSALARRAAPESIELLTVGGGRRGGALRRRLLAAVPPSKETRVPRAARVLVIGRGTFAFDVEEAWQSSVSEGLPILAVVLVDHDNPLTRRLHARHGIRTA
jgi:hypothetical protein